MIISTFKYLNKLHWCVAISSCSSNEDLETDIKDFLKNNYAPEVIHTLRPNNDIVYEIKKERIPNFENIISHEYKYSTDGSIKNIVENVEIDDKIYQELLSAMYSRMLIKYDSVLKAGHESYFILPAGNFATHFIRIGNIFKESEEINMLSIFLLPHLKDNPEIIYCDTPTIFSLIYACILYKNLIGENPKYNPRIKFYSSYNVTRDIVENTEKAIFIVSTSINGSLPTKLNDVGIDWSKIVVLYSFDQTEPLRYNVLCKQTSDQYVSSDFESLKPEDFKKRFPNRTFEIKFENEQFIPTSPTISKILLTQNDARKTLSRFMHNYLAYDFISCYKGKNSMSKTRDLYFDVSKLLRSFNEEDPNYFEKKTKQLLINQLPINITSIVYVDDDESKYLADKIKDYYNTAHKKEVNCVSYKNLKLEVGLTSPSCYLICSSCISNGKKISEVSRKLRSQEHSQIIYFNGFVRCIDDEAYKNLKSNIKYGKYSFTTYSFITVDEILLPNEDSDTISWESEKELLTSLLEGFNEFETDTLINEETKNFFKLRYDELVDNQEGLVNNVFLNKSNGDRLLLNKNFAFFDFETWKPNDIQQSKVYFTILSVLHNYRIEKKIKQTIYERFILDPENFNRYNDGIIQASILRAATTKELNYQIDSVASSKVTNIIISEIQDSENKDTAPYEFLMAICIGKLTLCNNDLNTIYGKFKDHDDNIIKVLLKISYQKYIISQKTA